MSVESSSTVSSDLKSYDKDSLKDDIETEFIKKYGQNYKLCEIGQEDYYCWMCHRTGKFICCDMCFRVFHFSCLNDPLLNEKKNLDKSFEFTCPVCKKIENDKGKIFNYVTNDQFYMILENALKRISFCEFFLKPIDQKEYPNYMSYIYQPMDLGTVHQKIKKRKYQSLEEYYQDIYLINHNFIVYFGKPSKLAKISKSLVRETHIEISEIELCYDCYLNSLNPHNEKDWFIKPCRVPHLLVYAKYKSYPYWPAKLLRCINDDLDVRFFGEHNRAIVPIKNCYWLSKEYPQSSDAKIFTKELKQSLEELCQHLVKLSNAFQIIKFPTSKSKIIDVNKPHVFFNQFKDVKCFPIIKDQNSTRNSLSNRNCKRKLSKSKQEDNLPNIKRQKVSSCQ